MTPPKIEENVEHIYDLFWYALNYRSADTKHAQQAWAELETCHRRIVEQVLRQYEDSLLLASK